MKQSTASGDLIDYHAELMLRIQTHYIIGPYVDWVRIQL